MFHLNLAARTARGNPFTDAEYADLDAFYARRADLHRTPLCHLPALAARLGIASLHVKDESSRFGLDAFKSLGVRYAIDRLERDGTVRDDSTLVCASAGNHGRAVARAARERGLAARVYMSSRSADQPRRAIASEGAAVVVVDGSYEDAVARMADEAAAYGWLIVSDTSWPGYDEIPRLIMLGYTRLMREVRAQLSSAPDVVFAQGGVGGLVCGVAAGLAREWPDARPRLVACEPTMAACLLASARAGAPVTIDGPLDTIMAGLRCAAPSPAAWPGIRDFVDAFVAVDDEATLAAIDTLARPAEGDPAIVAGPSGACGLASLVAVLRDPALRPVRDAIGLGRASSVVVINTEGQRD